MKLKAPLVFDLSFVDMVILTAAFCTIILLIKQMLYMKETAEASKDSAQASASTLRLTKLSMARLLKNSEK